MRLFYNTGIYLLDAGLHAAGMFNDKARLWCRGRRRIFSRMAEAVAGRSGADGCPDTLSVCGAEAKERTRTGDGSDHCTAGTDLIWFHCASLGEFEQGRPVIEAFRAAHPGWKILLTFFSPSGYEVRKNYAGADYIFYLPADTPRNARRFVSIFRPKIAVFVKYEFWANYLFALQRSGARAYLISGIFRPGQSFFKPWGGLFRRVLGTFNRLFVQNEESLKLLQGIGAVNAEVAGDTRFDRVYAIAQGAKALPEVERFAEGAEVFVAGSTWPPDEQLLLALINANPDVKFILAPHEVDPARIERMIAQIDRPCLRYTQLTPQSDLAGGGVLFIDTIGILSSVYRYGKWGYIGGGFGVGIHNTLEAATFGLPLAFGPNYEKFQEARDLIGVGGARSISDYAQLADWFGILRGDAAEYQRSSSACAEYVRSHKGATGQIIAGIRV